MKRQMYSMSHQWATRSFFGRLLPTCIQEVCPGDTWSGKVGMLVRLSPLKRALLHDIYVDQFMFYIPHRLVMAEWEDFISAGPQDTPRQFDIPTVNVNPASRDLDCLMQPSHATETKTYSALRLFAYNLVLNEFFRDVDDPVIPPTTTPGSNGLVINAKKDYWSLINENLGFLQTEHFAEVTSGAPDQVSAVAILEAIAKQKISMKRATYGTRYIDILRSYGINVNYQMLQRPEVVAMARGSINVTDVVQTAPGAGGGEDALGALAGHGISGTRLRLNRKTFPEHGTLMGFVVVRPVHADTKFTDWFDRGRPYENFYDPGLVPLPPVEITQRDVVNSVDTAVADEVLGFQPWGEWYRGALSRAQTDLEEWIGGMGIDDTGTTASQIRKYDQAIQQFDDLFTDTTFGHYQVSAVNSLRALRLIPRNNIMKSQILG